MISSLNSSNWYIFSSKGRLTLGEAWSGSERLLLISDIEWERKESVPSFETRAKDQSSTIDQSKYLHIFLWRRFVWLVSIWICWKENQFEFNSIINFVHNYSKDLFLKIQVLMDENTTNNQISADHQTHRKKIIPMTPTPLYVEFLFFIITQISL